MTEIIFGTFRIDSLLNLLTIEHVLFSLLGYDMSFLEFAGTLLNLLSVWLVARGRISTWPIGIVGSVLFAFLFYQLRLYADFIEQIYYVGACIYGWWLWQATGLQSHPLVTRFSPIRVQVASLVATLILSGLCILLLRHLHLIWPALFTEPATWPSVDGLTTVASFVAMILMAQGRVEAWLYWIVVNLASIGLYWVKEVYLVMALYGLYLVLAILGWRRWRSLVPQGREATCPEKDVGQSDEVSAPKFEEFLKNQTRT